MVNLVIVLILYMGCKSFYLYIKQEWENIALKTQI